MFKISENTTGLTTAKELLNVIILNDEEEVEGEKFYLGEPSELYNKDNNPEKNEEFLKNTILNYLKENQEGGSDGLSIDDNYKEIKNMLINIPYSDDFLDCNINDLKKKYNINSIISGNKNIDKNYEKIKDNHIMPFYKENSNILYGILYLNNHEVKIFEIK